MYPASSVTWGGWYPCSRSSPYLAGDFAEETHLCQMRKTSDLSRRSRVTARLGLHLVQPSP